MALARTSVLVVASGVKSILDIGATLERLDTLGVPVVGYQTRQFPGFYLRDSGFALDWSVASAEEAAHAFRSHREFSPTGLLARQSGRHRSGTRSRCARRRSRECLVEGQAKASAVRR